MFADITRELTVLTEEGTPVALDSLWRERPAVVAFVRHFG